MMRWVSFSLLVVGAGCADRGGSAADVGTTTGATETNGTAGESDTSASVDDGSESDGTGEGSSSTGLGPQPFGVDVVLAHLPEEGDVTIERWQLVDGVIVGPTVLNEPFGDGSYGFIVEEYGSNRFLYSTAGALEDVFLVDLEDETTELVDIGVGAVGQVVSLRWIPGIDGFGYDGGDRYVVATFDDAGGIETDVAALSPPGASALSKYNVDTATGRMLVQAGDGLQQGLYFSDLNIADEFDLVTIYEPTQPWEGVTSAVFLPDEQGVAFLADRSEDGTFDLFVAMAEGAGFGQPIALTSIASEAEVRFVTPHALSGGLIYQIEFTGSASGLTEAYWVEFAGGGPAPAVALNADGEGRVGSGFSWNFSGDGRFFVYDGSPVDDGSPLALTVVDFEGGTPAPPQEIGEGVEGLDTHFFAADRFFYYQNGGRLFRVDMHKNPFEPELLAEFENESVRPWDLSPDESTLCFTRETEDVTAPDQIGELYVVDVSGDEAGSPLRVSEDLSDGEFLGQCRFTPDGRGLGYEIDNLSNFTIALAVVDLESPATVVARLDASRRFSSWEFAPFTPWRWSLDF